MFDWIVIFRNSVRDIKMQCEIIIFYIICDILNLEVYSFNPKHQSKNKFLFIKGEKCQFHIMIKLLTPQITMKKIQKLNKKI